MNMTRTTAARPSRSWLTLAVVLLVAATLPPTASGFQRLARRARLMRPLRAKGFGDNTDTVKKMKKKQELERQKSIQKEVAAEGNDLGVDGSDVAGYAFDIAPEAGGTDLVNMTPEQAAELKRQELATRGPDERDSELLKTLGITDASPFAEPEVKKDPFEDPTYDDPRNVLSFVPMEVQGFLDTFLTALAGLSLTAFLLTGIAITADAFYRSSNSVVPENIAALLNFVEPKFTAIGIVFLGSSVALGNFKLAQITNPVSVYEEEGDEEGVVTLLGNDE